MLELWIIFNRFARYNRINSLFNRPKRNYKPFFWAVSIDCYLQLNGSEKLVDKSLKSR